MVLKRTTEGDNVKVIYESSTILASSYNEVDNSLVITFKNGGQYKYDGVKNTDYTRFELADSQGKVLNSHIKQYPFTKLDNVNPDTYKSEIHEAHISRSVDITLDMVSSMKTLIVSFDSINSVNVGLLKDVERKIATYNREVLKEKNE